jgi:hypothetical protein
MCVYYTAIAAAAKDAEAAARKEDNASRKSAVSLAAASQQGVTPMGAEEVVYQNVTQHASTNESFVNAGTERVLEVGEVEATDVSATGDVITVSADATTLERGLEVAERERESQIYPSQTVQAWRNEASTSGEINVLLSSSRELDVRGLGDTDEGARADGGMGEVDVVLSVMQEEVERWISSSQLAVLSLEKAMKVSPVSPSKQVSDRQ